MMPTMLTRLAYATEDHAVAVMVSASNVEATRQRLASMLGSARCWSGLPGRERRAQRLAFIAWVETHCDVLAYASTLQREHMLALTIANDTAMLNSMVAKVRETYEARVAEYEAHVAECE